MDHFPWSWSAPHGDWYFATKGPDGNLTYHWSRSLEAAKPTALSSTSPQMHSRLASGNSFSSMTSPTESVPPDMRIQIKDFIAGAPTTGRYELLDSSYRRRTGAEVYEFFVVGRIFAMLHVQVAGPQAVPSNDNITTVKYGEQVFCQIRRFVIVEVRRDFVYACTLTTYSGRATLRTGCIPSEHSIVYLAGHPPTLLPGEYLTKEPIRVNPTDSSIRMDVATRIHYAKVFPIEMNVKVKDLGSVDPEDRRNLLRYYREENSRD